MNKRLTDKEALSGFEFHIQCVCVCVCVSESTCVPVICDALGYSLKDKCLPGAESESESESRTSLVRTATTERLVRLFNPLLTMLQHLKSNLRPGNSTSVKPESCCVLLYCLRDHTVYFQSGTFAY